LYTFFTILSSGIQCKWPNQLNLCAFMWFIIFLWLINTLRTGYLDPSSYVTTVQDGLLGSKFLRYNGAGRVTWIQVLTLQRCRTGYLNPSF
jgi:hypothetical protein